MGVLLLGSEAALLLALRRGPGYGLELLARVRRASDDQVRLGHGNVYGALARLEKQGLAHSWTVTPGRRRGGRARVVYELTPAGIAQSERLAATLGRLCGDPRPAPSDAELARMARRLTACADLSASVLELAAARRG